ncbi:hypothetical protein ACRXB1_37590, partial [Caballeronia sp. M23-90]
GEAELASVDSVLEGVRAYFQYNVERGSRQPVPQSLETAIDTALTRITRRGGAVHAEADGEAELASVDSVLEGVRAYFQYNVERGSRQPVPQSLETAIDTA